MSRLLSLTQHTLYADLLEQGSDDLFDPDLPENGSLLVRSNRPGAPADHVYYQGYRPAAGDAGRGLRFARYLGRADDPDVAARIARFQQVKAVRAERTTTVRALIGAGMPRPDRTTGRIIEALARAGLFPEHAVLTGEAAYQTYAGVLGVRLPKPRKGAWGDRSAIEIVVRDRNRLPCINETVRALDPSYALVQHVTDPSLPENDVAVAITSLDHADAAAKARFEFLISDPVCAIVLHGPGIPVAVPSPERFAIHILMEVGSRSDRAPSEVTLSDRDQAAEFIDALFFAHRAHALAAAFSHAWSNHPDRQRALHVGMAHLPDAIRTSLAEAIER